jgi:hypothetical protein
MIFCPHVQFDQSAILDKLIYIWPIATLTLGSHNTLGTWNISYGQKKG